MKQESTFSRNLIHNEDSFGDIRTSGDKNAPVWTRNHRRYFCLARNIFIAAVKIPGKPQGELYYYVAFNNKIARNMF